jgi:hypothetical protein
MRKGSPISTIVRITCPFLVLRPSRNYKVRDGVKSFVGKFDGCCLHVCETLRPLAFLLLGLGSSLELTNTNGDPQHDLVSVPFRHPFKNPLIGQWSSYGATAGIVQPHGHFGHRKAYAQDKYSEFVQAGIGNPSIGTVLKPRLSWESSGLRTDFDIWRWKSNRFERYPKANDSWGGQVWRSCFQREVK